jgi:hypothetical protein
MRKTQSYATVPLKWITFGFLSFFYSIQHCSFAAPQIPEFESRNVEPVVLLPAKSSNRLTRSPPMFLLRVWQVDALPFSAREGWEGWSHFM